MSFKYTVADPDQNCGLVFEFTPANGSEPIRVIHDVASNTILQLEIRRVGVWRPANLEETEAFIGANTDDNGTLHIDGQALDINRCFDLPAWAWSDVKLLDSQDMVGVNLLIEKLDGDIDALDATVKSVLGAMSDAEREELVYTKQGLNILGAGGLSLLGVFSTDVYKPWSLAWEDLGLDPNNIHVWLQSAKQHGADTGEQEDQVQDLEELLRACGQVIGRDRLVALMPLQLTPEF